MPIKSIKSLVWNIKSISSKAVCVYTTSNFFLFSFLESFVHFVAYCLILKVNCQQKYSSIRTIRTVIEQHHFLSWLPVSVSLCLLVWVLERQRAINEVTNYSSLLLRDCCFISEATSMSTLTSCGARDGSAVPFISCLHAWLALFFPFAVHGAAASCSGGLLIMIFAGVTAALTRCYLEPLIE